MLEALQSSPDPGDNFLLAMAGASEADYLVTGDKRDVQLESLRALLHPCPPWEKRGYHERSKVIT